MIACFLEDIEGEVIEISGEAFVHLNSSLRVKPNDQVLLLNGKGDRRITIVQSVEKRKLFLSTGKVESEKRRFKIDLLISPPKRDAFNDCLRFCGEIGIRNIYLFESEYCQNKKIDEQRCLKILRASLVQSNNPYLPNIKKLEKNIEIGVDYQKTFLFHLNSSFIDVNEKLEKDSEYLIVIGPEGGFSEKDLEMLKSKFKGIEIVQLSTSILRAPTALCVASGWVLSKI